MRPDPLHDAVHFLTRPDWFTPVFWLLLLAAIAIAALVWRREPAQRTPRNLGIWGLRVLMGAMWWQQTLWKIPPNFDGLKFWMQQEADHAAIALQGALVRDVVLPNLAVFGPLVYLVELAIGVSLLLGLFSRAGALLGLLMGLNLWLGLYSADNEWPWTYMFLVMIQAWFVIDPPGRVLGADALLASPARTASLRQPVLGELNDRCHDNTASRTAIAGAGCRSARPPARTRSTSRSPATPRLRRRCARSPRPTRRDPVCACSCFPPVPGLILPQLVRDIQNDIVVTQTAILEQAAQAGVIASAVRAQWRNPLVIAGLHGAAAIDRHVCRDRSVAGFGYRRPGAAGASRHQADPRTRRRRYRRGGVPADHRRGAGRTAAHDRCPRRRTACGHPPGAAPRCNRRCSMRRRSHDWRGGRIPKASSPSSPPRRPPPCSPRPVWRRPHDTDPRRAAASAVAPHPPLGDGAVDPDHDRQRLAHLQCQPDLRLS